MFILPYVYSTRHLPTLTLHTIRILTLGGTELWREEDTLRLYEDILEPNGLSLLHHNQYKDIHLCLLDPTHLNLSEYYDWAEVSATGSSVFCWRTFHIVQPLLSPSSLSPLPSSSVSLPPSSFSLPPPPSARLGPYTCEELLTHLKPCA